MYKLIAFDLDGTLLTEGKTITEENLDTIHKLMDRGIEMVIATGRSYTSARTLTKDIKADLVYISNNGNLVVDSKDEKILLEKILNIKDARTALRIGEEYGTTPLVHVNKFKEGYDVVSRIDNPVVNKEDSHTLVRTKLVEDFSDEDLEGIVSLAFFDEVEKLKAFYKDIVRNCDKDKYSHHMMENVESAESLVEIMNPDGTKWNTLKEYADSRGIKPEEIIAFGDDNNDIEMIKNAGLGFAMKNATDIVKSVADRITRKNNDDSGIAVELREVFDL